LVKKERECLFTPQYGLHKIQIYTYIRIYNTSV